MPKPPFCRLDLFHYHCRLGWLRVAHGANALQDVLESHRDVKPIQDPLHRAPRQIAWMCDIFAPIADDGHRCVHWDRLPMQKMMNAIDPEGVRVF